MSIIIGLTGNLGSGKTTVASILRKLGAKMMDADTITHQEMQQRGACFKRITRAFGSTILKGKEIDRQKLGAIVFVDPRKLKKLVNIVHPVVRKRILATVEHYRKKKGRDVLVVSAPLFFEGRYQQHVDFSIVVKANRNKQLQRASQRLGISKAQALKRIRLQMPQREKIRLADIIIDNNGNLKQTERQVKAIWQKIKKIQSQ